MPPIGHPYEWWVGRFKASGINYVRIDVCDKYDFTYRFCKEMEMHHIVVEATMASNDRRHFGDHRIHIRNFKGLRNIIIECWNEFIRKNFTQSDIDRALEIADYALSQGMIVSGGGWGYSQNGKAMSDEFFKHFKGQVATEHRRYPPLEPLQDQIRGHVEDGFAVLWNEVLMKPYPTGIGNSEKELKRCVKGVIDAGGSGILDYMHCEKYMSLMGRLCQKYNQ